MQSKQNGISNFRLGIMCLALLATHTVMAEESQIKNGGFEDGVSEPGRSRLGLARYGAWTSPAPGGCSGSTEILGLPYPTGFGAASIPAYEGDQAMNLGPCFGTGSISQSFATTPGAGYKVSLALRNGKVTVSVFNDHRTDLSADTGISVGRLWSIHSFSFTATSIESTIELQNSDSTNGDCCASVVDDIRVTRVPATVGGGS